MIWLSFLFGVFLGILQLVGLVRCVSTLFASQGIGYKRRMGSILVLARTGITVVLGVGAIWWFDASPVGLGAGLAVGFGVARIYAIRQRTKKENTIC